MKPYMTMVLGVQLLFGAGMALGAPSSLVAFTPETRSLIASGDPARGKDKAAGCVACHGAQGIAENAEFPSLAGQRADYLYKQLRDYKDDKRVNPLMTAFAGPLSDEDMADIAAWYASQPLPPAKPADGDPGAATTLVRRGDGARLIPACAACHASNGEGQAVAVPALAGQNATHFAQTLQAYKSGTRANDVYSVMRNIARALSKEEIVQLAKYYASLGK